MSGNQQIVAAGGAGLVVLAFWDGPGRSAISDGLFNSAATPAQQDAAHSELKKLAAAAVFVAAATVIAGVSTTWARVMVATIVGLFILWAINRYAGGTVAGHPVPVTPITPRRPAGGRAPRPAA